MANFTVPTRDQVTPNNQEIFDNLNSKLNFVPNLYAYYAKNDTALGDYLTFQGRKSTLSGKEGEIINLVTSQISGCSYCLAAHTALGKMNGFTDEQVLEIRSGRASFNEKFDALAQFTAAVVENRGNASSEATEQFLAAGYTEANLIDVIVGVGTKLISNYIHNITKIPVDFPAAPALETTTV